jgi:hypothetical protein
MLFIILSVIVLIALIIFYVLLAMNARLVVTHFKFSDYPFTQIGQQTCNTSSQSIQQPPSRDLSIVFPAYLEEVTADYQWM